MVGYEVVTMLAMLVLGSMALLFEPITDHGYWLFANPLVIMYASGVAFNLLDAIVRVRRRAALPGAPRWRGSNYTGVKRYLLDPAVFNFMFDTSFLAGVIIINRDDESSIILMLILLTAARFFAHVAGRPSRLVLLPAILPVLFFALQRFYTPNGQSLDQSYFIHVALATIFVLMAYAFISLINQRVAEEAALTIAIAERDQKIKQSEITAEQDAKRLAEQVLRLDLLQDSIRAINSAIELDELLLMIVNNAVRVLKAEQSSIGLIDDRSGELVIQCATGVAASKLRRKHFMPGVGVAGWVAQKGLPLVVGDVREDTRYVDPNTDAAWGRATRSMLCVPLIAERKVIGTLCVTHSRPYALTEDDQELLTGFAEQAALAVHKSKLLDERTRQGEELRRRGDLIASLHSIGQSVLSTLDLPQVLDTIITRMNELTSFDQGVIYLMSERTGQAERVASTGRIENPEKLELTQGTPSSNLWRKAQATNTAQSCKGGTCILCLPLVNRGKTIGCILLAREGDHQFTDVERDTAEKLADAATLAIVNARLFGRVSDQQQQTAALYRLMLKVNAASNRRQLAQLICSELQQILGATASALLIQDTEHARLSGWASYGDWLGYDIGSISLSLKDDPFVADVLSALHDVESPGLLVIPGAPSQVNSAFNSPGCVTVPLAQSGRIYGLLVVRPGHTPPIPDDIQETASLAVSHSTVALERAELFEQTLTAARQSSMLYSIAAEIQTSLDPATVVNMTVNGALESLPILSCELYIFDDDHKELRRVGMATSAPPGNKVKGARNNGRTMRDGGLEGPDTVKLDSNRVLEEVLNSPGMVEGDLVSLGTTDNTSGVARSVVLGRLMGSEEPLGILRLTTTLPAPEFINRHATFCQTLLTHSGGALERSRLYTKTANQALMLRQRTDQMTDILNLGILSADMPLSKLMPQVATNIARSSLRFAYVRLGLFDPENANTEVWASTEQVWPGSEDSSQRALSLDSLRYLMKVGKPAKTKINGVYLDESLLADLVPGQSKPRKGLVPRQLVLMPLESISGGTLGYILAALNPDMGALDVTRHDFLEVLSIFAVRISLIIENHLVYAQLLDSKRKIEGVVLSISDGVIVTDSDLNVLISNSLADELLGAPAGETEGRPLENFINNEDLLRLLRECLTECKSGVMDVDLGLGRDLRTYSAVAHPIVGDDARLTTDNGKSPPSRDGGEPSSVVNSPLSILGAVLTLRDVTAERATERAKSDFLSIVSHELRTPLNSVMGFLDIILMGKTGELNDLQADFLGTAKQEAVALQRLIHDLLDYSQLQSRMLRLEMAPVNLSSVMARVANQAVPRMEADQLTLVNNVPQGLLVVGDEIRLEQVFKNLLDNAAKFTDPGGEIRFDSETTGDTVIISVTDTGSGIPPAQVADVFDRFFQAENVASRPKRGLGLGLAICKNIVEAHGGKIWLESELGVGTTVHVELLLFNPDSTLYTFDTKTGKATLHMPLESISAER